MYQLRLGNFQTKPLAQAIAAYAATKPPVLFPAHLGDTAHTAALILAQAAKFNDATVYFYYGDSAAPKAEPESVGGPNAKGEWELYPDFSRETLSVEFAANLPPNLSPDTPVAWTRGLRPDGTWAPDSPLQGRGGFIIHVNGQFDWAEKLSLDAGEISLHKFNTTTPTVNILEALPPGAVVLSAEPRAVAK